MPFRALSGFVEELLEVRGLPGLSLAVTDRDGLVALATFGYADLSARKPVAPETAFEHGSIGKAFTAVLLLQLHDEASLDLQSPVARYLPWFDVRSEHGPITPHHLLTHTAGIVMGSDASADSRFDVWALRETEAGFPRVSASTTRTSATARWAISWRSSPDGRIRSSCGSGSSSRSAWPRPIPP